MRSSADGAGPSDSRRDAASWFDGLRSDLRTSLRSLIRQPGFASAVVVTLALGLGVNAAMFSFLDRVFLRPPAGVTRPSDLRRFWLIDHNDKGEVVAYPLGIGPDEETALAASVGGSAAFATFAVQPNIRVGDGDAPSTTIVRASAAYLPLLGVHAAVGRLFTNEESVIASPAHVAVISDAFWHGRLGGDSAVVGKRLKLSGESFTIIGVTPPGFAGVDLERTDIWIPLGQSPIGMSGVVAMAGRRPQFFALLARVTPRVSDAAIEARATGIIRRADQVDADADSTARVVSGSIIQARGPGKVEKEVAIAERMGGVAAIVLLIACANIVNLLLARAAERRREIAVRLALGISRARLVWLLAAPTLMLAMVAGVAAAASAQITGALLRAQLLPGVQFADQPIHWRVIAFTLLVAIVAGALSAVVPAVQSSRPDVMAALKAGGQSGGFQRSPLRAVLVVAQTALSVVLLAGAALFLRSAHNIESIKLGYDISRLASAGVRYDDWRAPDSVALARAAARVRLVPGVEQVATVGEPPLDGGNWITTIYTAHDSSRGGPQNWPALIVVSPNYFKVTGVRVLHGRPLDDDGTWSIVVNETMARQYWPHENAVGQCLRLNKRDSRCYTVVGVAEDAHRARVIEAPRSYYYVPAAHPPGEGMRAFTLLIRAEPRRWGDVTGATRRILVEEFPGGRPSVDRMDDAVAPAYRPFRLGALLFSIFGALAFVVALLGVYSTGSYVVTQRTREFGVRIAIGAQLGDVVRLVLGDGLRTVAAGAGIGVVLALLGGRLVGSLLYDVKANDPLALVGAVTLLLGAGAAAAMVPAWRAARVDPVVALRAE